MDVDVEAGVVELMSRRQRPRIRTRGLLAHERSEVYMRNCSDPSGEWDYHRDHQTLLQNRSAWEKKIEDSRRLRNEPRSLFLTQIN